MLDEEDKQTIDKAVDSLTLEQAKGLVHGFLGILAFNIEVMQNQIVHVAEYIELATEDQVDNIQSAIDFILRLDGVTIEEMKERSSYDQ